MVMVVKLNILTHKMARSGRELYHLQFSLQAASSENSGYTLLSNLEHKFCIFEKTNGVLQILESELRLHSNLRIMFIIYTPCII
jgi:hypothetical protein